MSTTTPLILIAGAGPAGIAASLYLSKQNIHHVIIDKASFPRDKICGDALSGKVVHVLNKLDPSLIPQLAKDEITFTGSYGVSFFSSNGKRLDVPFSSDPEHLKHAPGFLSKRFDFDHFLFRQLNPKFAHVQQVTELVDIRRVEDGLIVKMRNNQEEKEQSFKLIIGAEGDRSIVRKKLSDIKKEDDHYSAGIRAYYKNVKETHEQHFIELHFLPELLPGYLWIFPMKNGSANVGVGILSSVVAKKKINLREELKRILSNHPILKERFKDAILESDSKGWGLPLGSKVRSLSGDNFILTGDAAALIDPFTGEGIGNALASGLLAGQMAEEALIENRYDAPFLRKYDQGVYRQLGPELKLSHTLQKLTSRPWLFNFIVNKALKSKTLSETITCMFEDVDLRKRLSSPRFYLKLLLNK